MFISHLIAVLSNFYVKYDKELSTIYMEIMLEYYSEAYPHFRLYGGCIENEAWLVVLYNSYFVMLS